MLDELLGAKCCGPLRIYVAGPLSVSGAEGFEADPEHVRIADAIGQELFLRGHWPFVPHTMTETWFDRTERAFHDYEAIVEGMDFAWLRTCDAIYLCPGWAHSRGASMEAAEAERLGLWMFAHIDQVPKITADVDGHHGLLEKRDNFSRKCRRRIILGSQKYGADWKTKDNLAEAIEETHDLENYAFLHRCQIEWQIENARAAKTTTAP